MAKLFLNKKNLELLINNLKASCDEFIAPKREHLGDIIFGDTKDEGGELLDYEGNSVVSPRAFLLPQTEPLLEIKSAKNCQFKPIEDKKKRIFYGVRSCDIKALVLMRKFFLGDIADYFYERKLKNSFFIVLSCLKPCSAEAFCYEMGSGPAAKDGFDLQLTAVRNGFLVEAGSAQGRQALKKYQRLFSPAKTQDKKEAARLSRDFARGRKKINHKKLARIMREDKIAQGVWEDIGRRCVVCSGCISLCPTCSCFSVADRLEGDKGMRFRYCDGCVYAGFTRMAAGNTPFPQHKDHIRRFFEHKLNVDVERYGTSSCVGCGRCIETCPGNISIRKFIELVGAGPCACP